jgi:uncharacterized membrane protein YjfL (UPF0719 family)
MISIDWTTIAFDAILMVVTFVIMTLIAYIALWILDKGLPDIDFLTIQNDPKAEAIASLGWLIIYSLVFAGSLIAPFSLDTFIIREIVWTFIIVMVAVILTFVAVRLLSPCMRYCGKDGLRSVGKEPISTAIFYLGLCVLIGVIGYTALVA